MNPHIAILLDLRAIDAQRIALRSGREEKLAGLAKAQQLAAMARTAADAAKNEAKRNDALIAQYTADAARCDQQIAELRGKQPSAKTNREYMALINGIEQAKSEKAQREQSVAELKANLAKLTAKAAELEKKSDEIAARLAQVQAAADAAAKPSPEEQALQDRYDARKKDCDPAFLEAYERLVKARHAQPLVRVDPATRATPYGQILSHNHIEQIRQGKLVIDLTSNSILYLE